MKITRNTILVIRLFLTSLVMLPGICFAQEINMPSIFADHMVLQRGQDVPVWGISVPDASVKVEFTGQKKTTTANSGGLTSW